MNSKVIKWFIRHTGIRKTDDTEEKKTPLFKEHIETKQKKGSILRERSNTLRKFSLSRLSLRKRHKRLDSPKLEVVKSSSYSSTGHTQMSPIVDSDIEHIKYNQSIDDKYSKVTETSVNDSKVTNNLVKQYSADAGVNRDYEDLSEKDSLKRSSMSLPDKLPVIESYGSVTEDSPENSDVSSSDSVETIKRVDNLDEESFMDFLHVATDNEEILENESDPISESVIEKEVNINISTRSHVKKQEKILEPHNKATNTKDSNISVNSEQRNFFLNSKTLSSLIETDFATSKCTAHTASVNEYKNNLIRCECEHSPIDTGTHHRVTYNVSQKTSKDNEVLKSSNYYEIKKSSTDGEIQKYSTDDKAQKSSTDGDIKKSSTDCKIQISSTDCKIQISSTDSKFQKDSTDPESVKDRKTPVSVTERLAPVSVAEREAQESATNIEAQESATNIEAQESATTQREAHEYRTDGKAHNKSATDIDAEESAQTDIDAEESAPTDIESTTDIEAQKSTTDIEVQKSTIDREAQEYSVDIEDNLLSEAAEEISIKNNYFAENTNNTTDLTNEYNESIYNVNVNSKPQSIHSSSDSLSKSNHQNESLAIFDEDGDISATSPTPEFETSISKSQKLIENNVKQLKKLTFHCSRNIKIRSSLASGSINAGSLRQHSSKDVPINEEISKVKIVITHPSPEKSSTTITHSQLESPTQNNLQFIQRKSYPEGLNPFGDDGEEDFSENIKLRDKEPQRLHMNGVHQRNPFGSDSEEEKAELKTFNSRHLSTETNGNFIERKDITDKPENPFGIYEDIEINRLSSTNPFSEDSNDIHYTSEKEVPNVRNSREDTPPNLPPKLDYRLRLGSLSSTPVPHPRKSRLRLHGSSNSLNSTILPPVPYPRSILPSSSSETLNSSQYYDDKSCFIRGSVRSSLPVSSQMRIPRKKRTAPPPPNSIQTQRSLSSDRPSIIKDDDSRSRETPLDASSKANQPPPRPPPPKIQLKDYKPNIKERFLRII